MPVPHPIPYQGSKRRLVPVIIRLFPARFRSLYEPFAGSAAVTIAAAYHGYGSTYVLGDSLHPLAELWTQIISAPDRLADRYETIWKGQLKDPREHFDSVRARFNQDREPAKLLYLLARCVKNAVRFNPSGDFNQSADHRRTGMKPEKMRQEIEGAAGLLKGRSSAAHADYRDLLEGVRKSDLVYMDPPYQGVSTGRDSRYFQRLDVAAFLQELANLNSRDIRFVLSFDGRTGDRTYGEVLPKELNLTHIHVHAGRSSQATLSGRDDETVESLYLSPALAQEVAYVQPVVHVRQIPIQEKLTL